MANQIIPRNILYINFASVKLNTIDEDMLKISSRITGEKDADTNTEFSLMTLNEKLFCAKNQSEQSDTPKINCSKSSVCLTII